MKQRVARLEELLQRQLAAIVQNEMRDPRVASATVTSVQLSADLRHARVLVSILGSEEHRKESLLAFARARAFLRRELARRLDLRATPDLRFVLDRGPEHSQRISDLLDSLPQTAARTAEEDEGQ